MPIVASEHRFYRSLGSVACRSSVAAAWMTRLIVVGVAITPALGQSVTGAVLGHRHMVTAFEPVRSDDEPKCQRARFDPRFVDPPVGGGIVVFDMRNPSAPAVDLTRGFAAAGHPDLSFDGRRILLAGKRNEHDPFEVWETNVDGTGLRQIAHSPAGCATPIYLPTTFTLDADQPVYQIAFSRVPEGEQASALYTCRMDGTRLRRITFNPYGATDPFIVSDGRLVYTSWKAPVEEGMLTGGSVLMSVNTDGTDVFIFAAADEAPAVRRMQCETADGWMIYVESALDEPDGGGSLVAVKRTRSLHTRRVIADDPNGLYRWASPLDDETLLVTYRPRHGDAYDIYELDAQSGTRHKGGSVDQWHTVAHLSAQPRPEPPGHSSVVDERVSSGKLYCMDAYLSDRDEARRIHRGDIKKVRVIQAMTPAADGPDRSRAPRGDQSGRGSSLVEEEVLGEADVERDGSFFLEVPARTALRLETLDDKGEILQVMTSWVWVMPRERRGCIGCHEDRELTPPNRHVYALRREPIKMVVVSDVMARPQPQPHQTRGDSE